MRAIAWLIWVGFVVMTCSTTVSAPMVVADLPVDTASTGLVLSTFLFTLSLLALSLYARFRAIPNALAAGRFSNPSARLLANLIGCWALGLFAVGGAIGLYMATGDMAVGFGVGFMAVLVVFVEAPRIASPPSLKTDGSQASDSHGAAPPAS